MKITSCKFTCKIIMFIFLINLIIFNNSVFAKNHLVGDIVDYTLNTDIAAYINHYPITSYNINGYTAIVAEDLGNYGFDVVWDSNNRTLNINRSNADKITPYGSVYRNANPIGSRAIPVLYTDIKTYINGGLTESYNIDGKTIIYFDNLNTFGEVVWVPEIRAIKMWIKGLPTIEYKSLPTSPDEIKTIHYKWSYAWSDWTYDLKIPVLAYELYKSIDRRIIGNNYSYYVTQSSDDEYIGKLASVFKNTANDKGYSEWDMIHLTTSFVQNLEYVSDKIATGYDEYPKFPIETLMDSGGDCEDTSILLASLLRELGYGVVLIAFDNHMAVGVKGADGIPGSYWNYNGDRYYYIETTNTGWSVGEIPTDLENAKARILPLL